MNNKNVLVSVIVPVYNGEKTLLRTLKAINRQSFKDFEVLIVDDGSTDNTELIIKDFINKNSEMKCTLLKTSRLGPGGARNKGINCAKGKYIVFIDSDDLPYKDYISTLYNSIIQDDSIDLSHGNYIRVTNNPKRIDKVTSSGETLTPEKVFVDFITGRNSLTLWDSVYKKEVIIQNKIQFMEHCFFGEDHFFIAQYIMCCRHINRADKFIYLYFYDKKKSMQRFVDGITESLSQSIIYNLLDPLKQLNWTTGYYAILNGRLSEDASYAIIGFIKKSKSYKEFTKMIHQDNFIQRLQKADRRFFKKKTFLKIKLLYLLAHKFPYVLYNFGKVFLCD